MDLWLLHFYSAYFFLYSTIIGHSIIQILPEISCKGLKTDDIPALVEKTHQLMQETYTKLNAETCVLHKKYE